MRPLLLAILLSGCGPSSFDDFRNQYTSRICSTARRCGAIGHRDPCPVPASLPTAGELDVPAAISDGKLRFDSAKAQDCLDEIGGAPCDSDAAALRIYEHCHAVIGPNVAIGNKCDSDFECVGGTCDATTDGCPGRCVAYPAPGSVCVPGECDPTVQYCGGGDSPTCTLHKSEGSRCVADDECDYPFFCVSGKCRHFPRTSDGKPCSDPAAVCNDGSFCNADSLCQPLAGKRSPCQSPAGCKNGNGCAEEGDGGVCLPWADVGQPCAAGLCPATASCEPDQDGGNPDAGLGGICLAGPPLPGGPREPCTKGKCAAGLYCDGEMICQWLRLRGGDCNVGDDSCAPGLTCDATSQHCLSNLVCPITDGGVRD